MLFRSSLFSQKHGVILGGTYGRFRADLVSGSNLVYDRTPLLNFMAGYGFNYRFSNRFELGSSLMLGQQKGRFRDRDYYFKSSWISLEEVAKYPIGSHIKIGVGVAPTWHMKMTFWSDNKISPIIDCPILLQTEYETKFFDVRLSYKAGVCNLLKNNIFDALHQNSLNLSVFIPFNR